MFLSAFSTKIKEEIKVDAFISMLLIESQQIQSELLVALLIIIMEEMMILMKAMLVIFIMFLNHRHHTNQSNQIALAAHVSILLMIYLQIVMQKFLVDQLLYQY